LAQIRRGPIDRAGICAARLFSNLLLPAHRLAIQSGTLGRSFGAPIVGAATLVSSAGPIPLRSPPFTFPSVRRWTAGTAPVESGRVGTSPFAPGPVAPFAANLFARSRSPRRAPEFARAALAAQLLDFPVQPRDFVAQFLKQADDLSRVSTAAEFSRPSEIGSPSRWTGTPPVVEIVRAVGCRSKAPVRSIMSSMIAAGKFAGPARSRSALPARSEITIPSAPFGEWRAIAAAPTAPLRSRETP
jgi:hypothetical protein